MEKIFGIDVVYMWKHRKESINERALTMFGLSLLLLLCGLIIFCQEIYHLFKCADASIQLRYNINDILFSCLYVLWGIFCILIIRNLSRGQVFSSNTVKQLFRMGYALLITFIVQCHLSAFYDIEGEARGYRISCSFLAFFILLIAEVFRLGVKMKEDSDLTI